jgi:bacterioferritin (cytochrome b1)
MSKAIVGNPSVIKIWQSAIALEAQLNEQYRSDYAAAKFAGFRKIQGWLKRFGDEGHGWRKKAQDRVLLLGGSIAYTMAPITEPETLTAMFENYLTLEGNLLELYESLIGVASGAKDGVSVHKAQHRKLEHEHHVGWLAQQLTLIAGFAEETGESRYIEEKI